VAKLEHVPKTKLLYQALTGMVGGSKKITEKTLFACQNQILRDEKKHFLSRSLLFMFLSVMYKPERI
jgi:hypothetical protein